MLTTVLSSRSMISAASTMASTSQRQRYGVGGAAVGAATAAAVMATPLERCSCANIVLRQIVVRVKSTRKRRPAGCGAPLFSRELLGGDHVHRELGRHLGVQANLDLVGTGGLDVAGQLDPAAVEVGAAGRPDGRDDIERRDRTDQPPTAAGPRRQAHLEPLELGLDLVDVAEAADLPGGPGALDQ